MLNNKKIIIFLILIFIFIISSIFYFILPDNKLKNIHKEEVWDSLCYLKEENGNKRIIKITNTNINQLNRTLISGTDIFKSNLEIKEFYKFAGFEQKNEITVFGNENGIEVERIYKLIDNGIIEGYVKENDRQVITKNGVKLSKIIQENKVEFAKKYIIPKINCDLVK